MNPSPPHAKHDAVKEQERVPLGTGDLAKDLERRHVTHHLVGFGFAIGYAGEIARMGLAQVEAEDLQIGETEDRNGGISDVVGNQ